MRLWGLVLWSLSGCVGEKTDAFPTDQDGDGFVAEEDCNDQDATVHPGAPDAWYDGIDSDCAGNDDNDQDGDGVAALAVGGLDCDDLHSEVYPGAAEECDGLDNNCDGSADEGLGNVYYQDADGDGYGNGEVSSTACTAPVGFVADSTDCNDADPRYNPGASEDCNAEVDYNCDGSVGKDDLDGDGYSACEDCNDADGQIHPELPKSATVRMMIVTERPTTILPMALSGTWIPMVMDMGLRRPPPLPAISHLDMRLQAVIVMMRILPIIRVLRKTVQERWITIATDRWAIRTGMGMAIRPVWSATTQALRCIPAQRKSVMEWIMIAMVQ